MPRKVSFFGQHENMDESHVTQEDLERIASLPVEESLRRYITLRNFNEAHPAFMNVRVLGSKKSMVISEDGSRWQPEFTQRCANVLLDCFVARLKDFAATTSRVKSPSLEWNANVAKMVAEVPTGITRWDDKRRNKFVRMVVVILMFLTESQQHKGPDFDATAWTVGDAVEHFMTQSGKVESDPDATCRFADFVEAFKVHTSQVGMGRFCIHAIRDVVRRRMSIDKKGDLVGIRVGS
jgi:hypothetical protein